ncbi:hypothetical protein FA13DRAFT_1715382 [Coprinellus micaceus]|uniref:Uncharacterized protein n=1 Tax=Coprinellus micaceus TaxID=71717 RepID=A0A4Y7SNJ7_COPMI|nr:hypothetical protein FA13DRAFT_1715382 [Coprinellus micaceus]
MSRARSMGPPGGGKTNPRGTSEAFQFLIPNQTTAVPGSKANDKGDPNANEVDDFELMRMILQADPLLSQPVPLPADQGDVERTPVGHTHGVADEGPENGGGNIDERETRREMVRVEEGKVYLGDIPGNSPEAPVPVRSPGESKRPIGEGRKQTGSGMTRQAEPDSPPVGRGQGIEFILEAVAEVDGDSCSGTLESEFASCKSRIEESYREEEERFIQPEQDEENTAFEMRDGASPSLGANNGAASEPSPGSIPGAFYGTVEQCILSAENEEKSAEMTFLEQPQAEGRVGGWSRFNPLRYWYSHGSSPPGSTCSTSHND